MRPAPVRHIVPVVGILAAVSILAGGFGCSKGPPPPQQVVKRQVPKPEAKPPVPPAAEAQGKQAEQVVLFDPRGKRDPFVSFVKTEERKKTTASNGAPLPPLQRYELGELKYVGYIMTKKGARALVEDAGGRGYSVTVGTRIGRFGGVVSRITGKEIFVREEFTGNRGEKVVRENGIQLTTAGGN